MHPQKVTPESLKAAVTAALILLLRPIQAEHAASQEWQDVETRAYPPPLKKEKKEKDKGSKHPGTGLPRVATKGSVADGGSQEETVRVEALSDGSVQGKGHEKVSVGGSLQDAITGLDLEQRP